MLSRGEDEVCTSWRRKPVIRLTRLATAITLLERPQSDSVEVHVAGELRCNATITFGIVPFPNPELRVHMDAEAKRIGFPQQAISHD